MACTTKLCRTIAWILLLGTALTAHAQEDAIFEFATGELFEVPGLDVDAQQSWSYSFVDYNNDGYPDLFFSESSGRVQLFENEGGVRFTSRSFNLQEDAQRFEKGMGAVWGDYDNDGDLDLHVPIFFNLSANPPTPHAIMLQENERGVFRVVSAETGLTQRVALQQSIWLDYDHDGLLDLYVAPVGASNANNGPFDGPTPEIRNRLYRNGGGGFVDVTREAGLDVELSPLSGGSTESGMAATDLNGDGWVDLFLPSEEGPSRIFFNDGEGRFTQAPVTDDLNNIDRPTGLARGDIDNDGDMDLLLASGGRNSVETLEFRAQMLLNLGDGQFVDVTEGVGLGALIALPTIVPSMGDVDNDGDLDITITGGSSQIRPVHFLFLNNGDGTFVEAGEERAGIAGAPALGRALGDYNLDGFLDVAFSIFTARTPQYFPREKYPDLNLYKEDRPVGFVGECLDCLQSAPYFPFFRGRDNGNRWLRVTLAGTKSNRSAIGARVFALAGGVRQMREIGGGDGYGQNEMVAHFGLGANERVEHLEVRWPSGQVDVIENIAAGQKVRIIEGSGACHAVLPSVWEHELPDVAAVGRVLSVGALVTPALFDAGARITAVTADLSAFGGDAARPLEDLGDGSWRLAQDLAVEGVPGIRELAVFVEQETAVGPHWIRLSKTMAVQDPEAGLPLFDDGPEPGWHLEAVGAAQVDPQATERVHGGTSAQALTIGDDEAVYRLEEPAPTGDWIYPSQLPGLDLQPFTHLSFWLHPNQAQIESLYVDIGRGSIVIPRWGPDLVRARVSLVGTQKTLLSDVYDLLFEVDDELERLSLIQARDEERGMWDFGNRYLNLDLGGDEWVPVHVPLDSLVGVEGDLPLSEVRFSGKVEGTIFVDQLRLTSNPEQPATAVLEDYDGTTPEAFALEQNYPNPFNSGTVIPLALLAAGEVELAVYNLAGQKVVTLVEGERAAGSYKISWDGRDKAGRALATGMYLYELRREGRLVQTRKLLLLR